LLASPSPSPFHHFPLSFSFSSPLNPPSISKLPSSKWFLLTSHQTTFYAQCMGFSQLLRAYNDRLCSAHLTESASKNIQYYISQLTISCWAPRVPFSQRVWTAQWTGLELVSLYNHVQTVRHGGWESNRPSLGMNRPNSRRRVITRTVCAVP
jgi:hypothetical protein